jgi:hypothetical protein
MDCILLQDPPQFVGVNAGLIQDGLRQPRAQDLARVDGYRHSTASVRVPQLYVRATLHNDNPAEAPQRLNELCTGETREARHRREG